jgi:hypothetical protein
MRVIMALQFSLLYSAIIPFIVWSWNHRFQGSEFILMGSIISYLIMTTWIANLIFEKLEGRI